jgi:tetratricopeptide (TPR) repeat protein
MKTLLIITFIFILPVSYSMAQDQSHVSNLLKEATELKDSYNEPQALDAYLKVLQVDSTNYEALWNASFLYSRIGNRFEDKDKKKQYFNKAKALAERALRVNSSDAESNFVMSVAMGRMALISGPKARVAASNDIKHYAEEALKYDSLHAGAWHVLGRWNYEVANLNFAERMAANLLFGGLPKGASDQNAIEDYKKAIKYDSDNILYYRDLAIVYRHEDQDQNAIETLKKLLSLSPKSPDDPKYVKEARQMLKKLQ